MQLATHFVDAKLAVVHSHRVVDISLRHVGGRCSVCRSMTPSQLQSRPISPTHSNSNPSLSLRSTHVTPNSTVDPAYITFLAVACSQSQFVIHVVEVASTPAIFLVSSNSVGGARFFIILVSTTTSAALIVLITLRLHLFAETY